MYIDKSIGGTLMDKKEKFILWFEEVGKNDVGLVGGKNASLGEMITKTKIPVPDGFAITAYAYRYFIEKTGLKDFIRDTLKKYNVKKIPQLKKAGKLIRSTILRAKLPDELKNDIEENYRKLAVRTAERNPYVAVRSSATAEDLPDASFAGQQETYLNVRGTTELIKAVKKCIASLFTDRAISYREDKGFDHFSIALSVAVQKMVNSKASGVMFTLDPDSGFRNVVYINGSYGLGELVVGGDVIPDQWTVFKPTMKIIEKKLGTKDKMLLRGKRGNLLKKTPASKRKEFALPDEKVLELADYGMRIEKHYGHPMDIEWAQDADGKIYIVQARPETVYSSKKSNALLRYVLDEKSKVIMHGEAIGRKIGQGKIHVIDSPKKMGQFKKGEVLVTTMTDPDWEPIMKIASAIITDEGGRTSHAAIVSRELGVPCIIGTGNATKKLKNGMKVTVDCTSDDGKIWKGLLKYHVEEIDIKNVPKTKTKIFVNIGVPNEAFEAQALPVDGVGLAREEFIINSYIREHPLAMIKQHREHEYVDKLSSAVAKVAAAFYPRPVILRFSDFKSNEYAKLKGGEEFEPKEDNPMIGWRGASRYISKRFEPAFRLECKAVKRVRDEFGLTNLKVMIPFCRTLDEAKKVLSIMKSEGLERGRNGLEVYVMAEIPANIILADKFSELFDGFSIGSNDLTQLTLGIDRDSAMLESEFDERNEAVKKSIEQLIKVAHKHKRHVGICGQAPSDYPEYAEFLVKCGIDSISVNPDVALKVKLHVAQIERKKFFGKIFK